MQALAQAAARAQGARITASQRPERLGRAQRGGRARRACRAAAGGADEKRFRDVAALEEAMKNPEIKKGVEQMEAAMA